jgi:hypothetical protein
MSPQVQIYQPDFLQTILRYALPDPNQLGKLGYDRNIIWYGRKGSGKSTGGLQLIDEIKILYGPRNLSHAYSKYYIEPLFNTANMKKVLGHVFFADDVTKVKQSNEALTKYFDLRHIVENATGMKNVLTITMTGVHRFTDAQPQFRENIDILFAKSVPTRQWGMTDISWKVMSQFFGENLLNTFANLQMRSEPRVAKALTLFSLPQHRRAGIVCFPVIQEGQEQPKIPRRVEKQPEEPESTLDMKTAKRILILVDNHAPTREELAYIMREKRDTSKHSMRNFMGWLDPRIILLMDNSYLVEKGFFTKRLYVTAEGYEIIEAGKRK